MERLLEAVQASVADVMTRLDGLERAPIPEGAGREWLSPEDAAEHVGVSTTTLARWRSAGEGPPYTKPTGTLVRYRRDELDDWMGSSRRGSPGEGGR
ncbi:MAG: helix-turn-helix domain-containing protein [Bacteroidota bacterium]